MYANNLNTTILQSKQDKLNSHFMHNLRYVVKRH